MIDVAMINYEKQLNNMVPISITDLCLIVSYFIIRIRAQNTNIFNK